MRRQRVSSLALKDVTSQVIVAADALKLLHYLPFCCIGIVQGAVAAISLVLKQTGRLFQLLQSLSMPLLECLALLKQLIALDFNSFD